LRERAARRDPARPRRSAARAVRMAAVTGGPPPAGDGDATGLLRLRLPLRPPIDLSRMFRFLAARAIPGVEAATSDRYCRTISLPNGCGVLSLRIVPGSAWVDCSLALSDLRDVTAAVQRCRRLLDLDADPAAIAGFFSGDPVLGPLAASCPGRRSPGAVDGNEMAIRAVLGQQVSVAAARRLGARLVALCGTPLPAAAAAATTGTAPEGSGEADGEGGGEGGGAADGEGLTCLFPGPAVIAGLDPAALPMPASRARTVVTLAQALAAGDVCLDPGADREEATARLLALPGIGPWTAGYTGMRALSDPDVFLPGDTGVVRALTRLGHSGPAGPSSAVADRWRPWRSYAVHQLWATIEEPGSTTARSAAGQQVQVRG
jgi:AraC family transcriptional regulator of adaptative response / DNA-3-methyladenine glycosylase II